MAKDQELHTGDRVTWNSHGGATSSKGKATGKVVKRITEPTTIKGHEARASTDDPQYIVESDKGGRAAHKPSALRKQKRK
jgi:hypothetical protein